MFRKAKFIMLFLSVAIFLCLMSNTYSRYVADAKGEIDMMVANWQILVNNYDITNNTNSTIDITPVIEDNDYVANDVMAPTSKGYFDVSIDPSNVEVSFKYTINLALDNESIPDLMITKYAILPASYVEGDTLSFTTLSGSTISNNMLFDKNTSSFSFDPFTIRVYFEWYDGIDEEMDDEADTNAASNGETFQIQANISFEQII